MPGITDPYLRDQLGTARAELEANIAVIPADDAEAAAPLLDLLQEVDSAVERMDHGTYGICEACQDTLPQERLLTDPLAPMCLDCLTGEEQRALERDLELAARIQRGLLPQTDTRFEDWRVHYRYKPAGVVSGDYCNINSPPPLETAR